MTYTETGFKTGDLEPSVTIVCTDLDGDGNEIPKDLTAATSINIRGRLDSGLLVVNDAAPNRSQQASGKVTHAWVTGETDTPGRIWFTVKVIWPGNRPQTFPPDGALVWDIEQSL